jgi:UDP-N-acetylmuramoylalanine--D-glutamate ligase
MTRDVKGRRVLVAGMGKSGTAAVELLQRNGAEVRAVDQKPMEPVHGVEVRPQAEQEFLGVDLIVLSPGVAIDTPEVVAAQQRGVQVIGEVELASWFLRGPVIGITGSNGKTTTTALIGHILRETGIPAQVGGNIGTPPTSMVDSSRDDQWNVFELSSFQLESIETFRARIAVATNVTDNHLDRHHTFENYAAAKARLFETQDAAGDAVLNADNPVTVSYAGKTSGQTRWFSSSRQVGPGMFLRDGAIWLDGQRWMKANEIPMPGVHNIENTMAAGLAARLAGAAPGQIAAAIRTFPGVEHRIEFVRELRGVRFYNDSKATSVDATMKAIAAFPGGLWVILGGKDKNSDYTVLREPLRMKARRVLLIGAAAAKIEDQLAKSVPVTQCGTIDRAVELAAGEAGGGDVVLLAPACASFDQFRSFEHRGEVFKELVRGLK